MVTSASRLPANRLLFELHEPRLQVVGQGGCVIQSAGVQPESFRIVAPSFVDGPLQEPFAKPLSDELGHQAELHQLNLMRLAAIQLGEPSGRAIARAERATHLVGR